MDAPLIRLVELSKSYGAVRALDRLTLDFPPGAVGLLGPNGAGKTTLLKLLLGLLRPSAGEARIVGFDPMRRGERLELRRRVGYMPESDCLLPGMSAVGLVTTLARITGLSFEDAMTRAHETLDYVGLEEARYRTLDEYSTGMKQRLKLAQALAHDPPILLLDEPTNGLDPKGRRHMLELIEDLAHAQRKHVLLCTHLLPDVERTCDHVVVLDKGRVAAAGSIAELTRRDSLELVLRVEKGLEAFAELLAAQGFAFEREPGGRIRLAARPGAEDADEVFELARRAGAVISSLQTLRSSLEEVFLAALRESGAEAVRESA